MKMNKIMRLASVLVVAVLLSTCAISGTFAKYTSTTSGSDTARVAKWQFNIGQENDVVSTNEFVFDLFNIAYTDANVDVNGLNDDAVVIAPGTTGSFKITLENIGEVSATYAIAFTGDLANVPLQFQIVKGNAQLSDENWKTALADLNVAEDSTNTKLTFSDGTAGSGTDYVEYTVHWRWVFSTTGSNTGDTADTNLGLTGTATPSVTATVTVTQVD